MRLCKLKSRTIFYGLKIIFLYLPISQSCNWMAAYISRATSRDSRAVHGAPALILSYFYSYSHRSISLCLFLYLLWFYWIYVDTSCMCYFLLEYDYKWLLCARINSFLIEWLYLYLLHKKWSFPLRIFSKCCQVRCKL